MNENNNNFNEENVPAKETEKVVTPEISEEITEEFNEDVLPVEDVKPVYTPPYVDIPAMTAEEPVNKKGIRLFALILCVAVLLSIFTSIGYYLGGLNTTPKTNKPVDVNLAVRPTDTDAMSAAAVYEAVNKSVVGVTAYNSETLVSGSGVVYSKDGYIVINDSLYKDISAAKFMVYDNEGNAYPAEFVAGDTRSDLAVLRITEKVSLAVAEFGNSDEVYFGEPIVTISRPTGADTKNNITTGIVSVPKSRQSLSSTYTMNYIQLDAALSPGSNGGALVNMHGQIIGIICSKIGSEGYEGMGFAIPMTTVKNNVESLIKDKVVANRARLGISYTEITAVQADAQKLDQGLYVAEIGKDSDAYGRLVEGDIITAVNGQKITKADIMLDVIDASLPGDFLELTVVHENGSSENYSVKLLADKGGSSYSMYDNKLEGSDNNSQEHNSSDFSFPFGD